MAKFDNSLRTKASASEIERIIDERFGEIINGNTEKKITSLSRNMTNKACQVNFDKMNIETCYRSGCQALHKKRMAGEIIFLREQTNENNFVIRSLFLLKLSNCKEQNLSYRVKKIPIAKICLKFVLMMKSSSVNM